MKRVQGYWNWKPAAGLLVVLAMHGAVLYGLWQARENRPPVEAAILFVNFINPSPPRPKATASPEPVEPAKREKPRPVEAPHRHLVAEAPVLSPAESVAPSPPPPEPAIEAPPAPPPKAVGPVTLSGELALACPTRTPPAYPIFSRRLGESGKVVLRVELDTDGRVALAHVSTSSGFKRLDEAALSAVGGWRCSPPLRDGQPVRAVALQPFQFNLE